MYLAAIHFVTAAPFNTNHCERTVPHVWRPFVPSHRQLYSPCLSRKHSANCVGTWNGQQCRYFHLTWMVVFFSLTLNFFVFLSQDFRFKYETRDPNYFEVFIEQPGASFTLTLKNATRTVWSCIIRQCACWSFFKYSVFSVSVTNTLQNYQSIICFRPPPPLAVDYSCSTASVPELKTYGEYIFIVLIFCIDSTGKNNQNKIV